MASITQFTLKCSWTITILSKLTRIIPIEPSIPREPKAPDNTRRAKSTRQYLEIQKCQIISREPKAQTIPRESKVLDNM